MNKRAFLWVGLAVGFTLLAQLWLCYFFSFGELIPITNDINPSNQWMIKYRFPPQGYFFKYYWLGQGCDPMPFTPYSVLALLPAWLFFTVVYPLGAALSVWTFYLLARELKFSVAVAVVGGLFYGWQGRILSNIYGGHFAPPLLAAMLPLAVWLAIRAIRLGSWCTAAVVGVVSGMMVATAFDQGALATWPVGFVFLAKTAQLLWRRSREALIPLGQLMVTGVVALLVALPALQLLISAGLTGVRQGAVEDPKAKFAWATQWSWPPEETLTYLVPGFFGWRSGMPGGEYWGRIGRTENWEQTRQGFRNFSIDTCVLGTIPFLLVGVGVWTLCRKKHIGATDPLAWSDDQLFYGRCFLGLAIVLFLLALGKFAPFYALFYRLPYMSTWRNPIKFLNGPGNFCLILLAVFGLHVFLEILRHEELRIYRRRLNQCLLATAAFLGLMFVATFVGGCGQTPMLQRHGYSPDEIRSIIANQRLTVLVAVALVMALWAVPAWRDRLQALDLWRRPEVAAGFVAALSVGQLWWIHSHYIEPTRFKRAYATNPMLDILRNSPEPVRVKLVAQDALLHYYLSTVFAYHGISTLDIPAASRLPEDYAQFFQALESNPLRLWFLAGVKYLAAPAPQGRSLLTHPLLQGQIARVHAFRASGQRLDDVTLQAVADPSTATHLLIELKQFLPKATFVPTVEILPDTRAVAHRLNAADWDPRRSLLVTADDARAANLGAGVSATTGGTVRLLRYDNNLLEIEARTESGGFLLVNDRFESPWRAYIDGRPAPVFRADLILRAVALPAGTSRVLLRFEPPAKTGYISLATLGVVLLMAVSCMCWKGQRYRPENPNR